MKSTSNFSIRARALAGCLAGMLAIAACGSSESTDGERDRNVDVGITVGGFGDPTTGIASTRLGDFSYRHASRASSRRQIDGSWLVMIDSWSVSSDGVQRLFKITRLMPDGSFDNEFGTNGVVTVKTPDGANGIARLTRYGQLLVLGYDTQDIGEAETKSFPSWVRRYDATTGQLDTGFSDGTLVLDNALRNSRIYSMDGGKGDTFVVVSALDVKPDEYVLTQFVGGVRNRLFGGELGDGSSGSVIVPPVVVPGEDKSTWVHDVFVNMERDGSVMTVFAEAITNCPPTDLTSDCQKIATRRGLGVQRFALNGSPMLKVAEEGGDGLLWLDAIENPAGVSTQSFQVDDIAEGDEQTFDERFVTVSLSLGLPNVYKANSSYTSLDPNSLLAPTGLNIEAVPKAEFGAHGRPIITYVPTEKPVIVGSLVDPSPGGSFFWTDTYPVTKAAYGPRLGDYPFSVFRVADLQTLDSGTFANIETIGANTATGVGFANLWSGRGYAKFDNKGQPNSLFTGARTMTASPLDGANPFAQELLFNTRLLAGDGDFFYTAAVEGFLGGTPSLRLQRYDANGGAGARTAGDPITITTKDVHPLAFGRNWLVADGKDAIYFRAFHRNQFGVGKALISTGKLDETYGDSGFASLGSIDAIEPGANRPPEAWFEAALQLNSDRSIDAIVLEWMKPEDGSAAPLKITTRRVPANGRTDLSIPATSFVTDPKQVGCECAGYAPPEAAFTVVVDADGGVVIGSVGVDIGEGGAAPSGYVKLLRFGSNGNSDSTFGTNGEARLVGLTGLIELPPTIVPRSNGEYIIGYSSIVATTGKGGAYIVEGQFLNLARVGTTGTPIDFTPPPPNPAADKIADIVNSTPIPNAPGGGIASLPVADQPAVTATEQSAEVAALPADVVRVSPDDTVRITLATSVADRAIDVRWSVPAALVGSSAKYTVTATPGGQTCVTATTSCVFKKLDPWTAYTFQVKTVSASSGTPADSLASNPVKPVRIVKRGSRTEPTKLITPASTGKPTWKATGGCTVTKDGKSFLATKDGALCTLSLTTAKAGKVPKTTRTITVVVRAVAK